MSLPPFPSKSGSLAAVLVIGLWLMTACSGTSVREAKLDCAPVGTSLATYDKYSSQFLDEVTKHPDRNLGGQVIWNTRYYMESLITAYATTGNVKYLRAFEDTGSSVMGLLETLTLLNVIDPSAPGQTATSPTITETGWPTYMATFGKAVPIPTSNGAVSLYAQSLYPRNLTGPSHLDITQQADGSLEFSWWRSGKALKSYAVRTMADLNAIAAEKLVFRQALGRIATTGAGLPAPGHYDIDPPFNTIWHAEQTGGILLPFARYLLIARDHPEDVTPTLAASWKSTVLDLASQYQDHFLSDGSGGYTLHNPIWMAHESADTDVASDYLYVEVTLRILLHELTGDGIHLSLARGLIRHQLAKNVPINAKGWLVLRSSPDLHSWSTRSQGPAGSIWDSLTYDNTTAESATEGGFFAETLHEAIAYNVTDSLGITADYPQAQKNTFQQYLQIPNADSKGLMGSTRNSYPKLDSSTGDALYPANNPFAASLYLDPESATPADIATNWQWMQVHDATPNNWPVGYFLRAWARSEAAMKQSCQPSM